MAGIAKRADAAAKRASDELVKRHPLQRMQSPSRGISVVVHVLGLCSFAGSYGYLVFGPRSAVHDSWGWHWQYLTILGLSLATFTFVLGLLSDITLSPKLFFLKNTLSLCSAPLEVLISLLYWGICAIDRTLVVPPEIHLDYRADIGFHLMPALLLTVDLLLLSPPWTIHSMPAMGISLCLAFGYWAWVEECYRHNGWYPYPIFELLSTSQRVMLFAFSALLMTGSTALLKWLYGRVNGLQGEQKKSVPGNVHGKKVQ